MALIWVDYLLHTFTDEKYKEGLKLLNIVNHRDYYFKKKKNSFALLTEAVTTQKRFLCNLYQRSTGVKGMTFRSGGKKVLRIVRKEK